MRLGDDAGDRRLCIALPRPPKQGCALLGAGPCASPTASPSASVASSSSRDPRASPKSRKQASHGLPDGYEEEGRALQERVEAAESPEEVVALAMERLSELDAASAVLAVYTVAKLGSAAGLPASIVASPGFSEILERLRLQMGQLRRPRQFARLAWAIGKLDQRTEVAMALVSGVVASVPPLLPQFSSQELSNTLWGLARVVPVGAGGSSRCAEERSAGCAVVHTGFNEVRTLASAIVAESSRRIDAGPGALSAQCLSNSLWAVARLELRGGDAERFARCCVHELCSSKGQGLDDFSPQGLANVLWAMAKMNPGGLLRGDDSSGAHAIRLCRAVLLESRPRLASFQPQELSMVAWAVAKLRGRGGGGGRRGRRGSGDFAEMDSFLDELAEQARDRLGEFAPQGVSNIAWALATADLLGDRGRMGGSGARAFTLAAVAMAARSLSTYPPQAISNLCWAAGRLSRGASGARGAEVASLAVAAAREATARMPEFGWQDLAGVLVALGHGRHRSPEALQLATDVLLLVAGSPRQPSMQVLLNITVSSIRLGVKREQVRPLVQAIGAKISSGGHRMNEFDWKQWAEVQRSC